MDQLLAAVAGHGEYHAVQVAADRLQFARTFRPTWAIVAGWCTVWVALLGVLFFFVKTTETCLAVIESDHRGTRIRLSGRLNAATLGRLRTALGEATSNAQPGYEFGESSIGQPVTSVFTADASAPVDAPPALVPPALVPPTPFPPPALDRAPIRPSGPAAPSVDPVPSGFAVNTPAAPAAPAAPAPPPFMPAELPRAPAATPFADGLEIPAPPVVGGSSARSAAQRWPSSDDDSTVVHSRRPSVDGRGPGGPFAVLDDGMRIDLSAHTLLGRDPVAAPHDGATQLVAIDDPTRSVSKTHVGIVFRDGSWWVTDLHSTNGVELVLGDDRTQRLLPGSPAAVENGARVRFGERVLELHLGRRV